MKMSSINLYAGPRRSSVRLLLDPVNADCCNKMPETTKEPAVVTGPVGVRRQQQPAEIECSPFGVIPERSDSEHGYFSAMHCYFGYYRRKKAWIL